MISKIYARGARVWTDSALHAFLKTLLSSVPRWKVVTAAALMLFITVTQSAQLLLLVPLMQLIGLDVQQGSIGWVADLVSSTFITVGLEPTMITVLVAFMFFTTALALIRRGQTIFNFKLQEDFAASLRQRLYRAVANVDWLTFSRRRSSDLTHALTIEVDRIGAATAILLKLATNAVLVTVYVLLAFRLSPTMTTLVFVSGAGLLLVLRKKTQKAHWSGEEISLSTNGLYSAAIEHLGGMKTAKSYGAEDRNAGIFSNLAGQVAQMRLNSIRNQAETGFWFSVGSVASLCVLLYIAFTVMGMSAAGLLLLLFLFNKIIPMLGGMQQGYQQGLNILPAFTGVMEMLACYESVAEPSSQPQGDKMRLRNSLRLESVSFTYSHEEKAAAIQNLDLTIPAGETTAIVGPSGAGKSTVADLLMGLVTPCKGRVLVDDMPLSVERVRSWRNQIGYVAQDTFLFNDTVRANLLWACPEASEENMWEALRSAAAEEFVVKLPEGLETRLGDRGVRLSGGERQRLALARALLRRPSLLILDEATSALDSENEKRVQSAIEGLHGHMTILVITHRLSTIRHADIIHVLENGRLVESGDWDSLTRWGGGRFRALCRAQGIGADEKEAVGHDPLLERL